MHSVGIGIITAAAIWIATAYEVEDLSVSDFGNSDAKLRIYRYEADNWLGSQYNTWVSDHLYGEFPGHQ